MKNSIHKTIKTIPLILLGILSLLLLTGKVRFGHGLGDVMYYLLIGSAFSVYLVYFFATIFQNKLVLLIIPFLSILLSGYLILKMTVWRGPEFRWNGDIFADSSITLKERKQKKFEKAYNTDNTKQELKRKDAENRI